MADIVFTITEISGNKAKGTIKWENKSLEDTAISGGYGKGYLPVGKYKFVRGSLNDKKGIPAFTDKKGNDGWIQGITPDFVTDRKDLGVHPDGAPQGTEGCIGLQMDDTKTWYKAFYDFDKNATGSLEVKDGRPPA